MKYYYILTTLLYFCFQNSFSQNVEIYPDYLDFGNNRKISIIKFLDNETDSIRRIIYFDSVGRITKETFSNYEPISGKYKIDGTYTYKYSDLNNPYERFYTNISEDTLKTIFEYNTTGLLRKKISWEYERKSKLREGAPDYGIDSSNGCIPAEEDIVRYREWTIRQEKKYKYKNGNLTKVKVPYEWKMEPRTWLFNYNRNSELIEIREYGYKRKPLRWIESFEYSDDKTIKTKEYFVTYWDKIPPKEIWTTIEKDLKPSIIKTDFINSNNNKLLEFNYENDKLKEIRKTINDEVKFIYRLEYE